MRHDSSRIEMGQQALCTVTTATAEDRLNSWIRKESVEFCGPCGIAAGQIIVLLKEARGIVHAKAKVLQNLDPSVEFLLLQGTRWRCKPKAVPCGWRGRTSPGIKRIFNTLRCCGEILCNLPKGMPGNLPLN